MPKNQVTYNLIIEERRDFYKIVRQINKTFLILCAFLAVVFSFPLCYNRINISFETGECALSDDLIRVVSFNLKRDFGIPLRRSHKWQQRREIAAQLIRQSGASIVGVQELSPQMRSDVGALLSYDYTILGTGRYNGQRAQSDEHSDIILKNDDVLADRVNTFWLSKNPERTSRSYFSLFPRVCTVVEVHIRRLGRTVRVFNTHLDHLCGFSRMLGVQVILEKMRQMNSEKPMPTVLMGDFNCKPDSKPIRFLQGSMQSLPVSLVDVYSYYEPQKISNTLHYFTGKIKPGAQPIDYIFVSDDFEVVDVTIRTDSFDGRYPSDHYPLEATLRLRNA